MSYQVLYRKYRPKRFEEVVGQDFIVKTLLNAINENKLSHAYLFAGPRGTGKTSIAKLFAKTINCTSDIKGCDDCDNCLAFNSNNHPDIIELDAASNNGIDDIRDLIEKVSYAPILGKYKVYIIDEVHMLSANAFNAFLKTLEEPPKNVIFILATTEPHKIIDTILSRCQRFNFSKISKNDMKKRLKYILGQEKISYDELAIDEIINLSDGGMRDVLSITEQVLAYGNYELRYDDVINAYGVLSKFQKISLLKQIKESGSVSTIAELRKMYQSGVDMMKLPNDLIAILKEMLFIIENRSDLCEILNKEEGNELLEYYNKNEVYKLIEILARASKESKLTKSDVLAYVEVAFIEFEASFVDATKVEVKELKQAPIKKEAKENLVKKEEKVEATETKESIEIIKESNDPIIEEVNTDLEYMLYILSNAVKEEKIHDKDLILNNISNFQYDSENYRFYNCLKDCDIFGSSKDAIILTSNNEDSIHCINEIKMNEALYYFLKDTYHIEKMIYALSPEKIKNLVSMYKNIKDYDLSKYQVKHYSKKEEASIEDKLHDMFGSKLRIE